MFVDQLNLKSHPTTKQKHLNYLKLVEKFLSALDICEGVQKKKKSFWFLGHKCGTYITIQKNIYKFTGVFSIINYLNYTLVQLGSGHCFILKWIRINEWQKLLNQLINRSSDPWLTRIVSLCCLGTWAILLNLHTNS